MLKITKLWYTFVLYLRKHTQTEVLKISTSVLSKQWRFIRSINMCNRSTHVFRFQKFLV